MCSPLRADELDLVRQAGLDGGSDALTAFLLKRLKKMNKKKKKRKPCIFEIPRPGHSLLPHMSAASHPRVSEGQSEALTCSPHPQSSTALDWVVKTSLGSSPPPASDFFASSYSRRCTTTVQQKIGCQSRDIFSMPHEGLRGENAIL